MFHPILLTGVALVGLPILLHLIMKQEPKRLPFPAFRFLKQKQFTNQRKLRLRHLILMALRMGLIALVALALFQPTLVSQGLNLRIEQPVAAVLVIDTSPSMGYVISESRTGLSEGRKKGIRLLEETLEGPWTLLDDARARAMEILDDLPQSSKVAVVDSSQRDEPTWALNVDDARKRLRSLKRTRAAALPVTRALEKAYQLFARIDQETQLGEEGMPRLLCVLSDRTTPSWDTTRLEDLKGYRERASVNASTQERIDIRSLYLDMGVEKPAVNFAITSLEQVPQYLSPYQPAVVQVGVTATTNEGQNVLSARLEKVGDRDATFEPQQRTIVLGVDGQARAEFRWDRLTPGVYQAEFRLETPDAIPGDGVRFWTFRVREPKRILTLVDAPPTVPTLGGGLGQAAAGQLRGGYWDLALRAKGWYAADMQPVDRLAEMKPEELAGYEAVCLAGVRAPDDRLWKRLGEYVEAGGKLVIFPSEELDPAAYSTLTAAKLLPAKFTRWVDLPDTGEGVSWAWNTLNYSHPLLEPFGKARELPNVDFVRNPPRTWRYWEVQAKNPQSIIAPYADAPDADARHGAVLEEGVGSGRVLLFTTDWSLYAAPRAHNYASTSFYLVMSNELVRHLIGDVQDRTFNHTAGQNVLLRWPTGGGEKTPYYLAGPEVIGTAALLRRDPAQELLTLSPEQLAAAGSYTVANEEQTWLEGFSVNAPLAETGLQRLGVEPIEELFGKDSVVPPQRELAWAELLRGKFGATLELFPFLMIGLLLFLAFENWLSNRFYPGAK